MSEHPIVSSFTSGISLVAESYHETAIASLKTALDSQLLSQVDISSTSLPKDSLALSADDDFWPNPKDWFSAYRPYRVNDGVLIIPVRGILLHGVSLTYGRYFTGYEYLVRAIQRGRDDVGVRAIVLHVDSVGGHVAALYDVCDMLSALKKPTLAFVAEYACSAAYALAASCRKIVGTQTCITGSIGVLCTTIDYSQMLERNGIKYHYVSAPEGGDKASGHYGEPTKPEFLSRMQAEANSIFDDFVRIVTRGRKITVEQIREMKANSFLREESLSRGLIDSVASAVDIHGAASDIIASFDMGVGDSDGTRAQSALTQETQETIGDSKMDENEIAAKIGEAQKQATAAERSRISAILGSEAAKTRPAAAQMLAFDTDKDADSAIAALAKLPAEASAQPAPVAPTGRSAAEALDTAMTQHAPNLAAGGEPEGETKDQLASGLALAKRAGIGGYL